MSSRLLASLDADISMAKGEAAADCGRAKRACVLVRLGRIDEATAELAQLRGRHRLTTVPEVAIRLNVAEGLVHFFGGSTLPALDKIRRAHAMAKAAGMPRMLALSAAWLAHLHFSLLNVDHMATHLREAFVHAGRDDHETLSRASLVAAVAAHSSDRYDLARPWYTASRVHAIAEGDDATMSALLHNMTSMGVMNLRQATLTGRGESRFALDALVGAESTSSYDELKGMLGLVTWVPLLRAYAASLLGDPKRAIELYSEHIEKATAEGQGRMMSYIHADLAWCHAQVGAVELASREANDALRSLSLDTQIDDQAATHRRLADTYALLEATSAIDHNQLANELWGDYALLQARTVTLLEELSCYAASPTRI